MTIREFYNEVAKADVSVTVKEFALAEIAKLDARNDKRRNTLTKEQIANVTLKDNMATLLDSNGAMTAAEIAKAMDLSTQKVSALAAQLVKEGRATVTDLKVKGKGTVKQYKAVKGD